MEDIVVGVKEYLPIRIDTINDNEKIDFELYTFEKERYYLFCTAFSNFRKKDLSATYIRRIGHLYVKKSDWKLYRKYLESNLSLYLSNKGMEISSKVDIIYDVSTSMIKDAFTEGGSSISKEQVENFSGAMTDFIFDESVKINEVVRFAEHDFYTYNHSLHVFIYSIMFAVFLGIKDKNRLHAIGEGAFLHDIGKSNIGLDIINKPGPLDSQEWAEMQRHPLYGVRIVRDTVGINDESILSIIRNHHERLDGKGYPRGIKDIELFDKIVGVADTYDAITSNRSYQMARNPFEALRYMIQTQSGRLDDELMKKFAIMLGSR